MFQKPEMKIKLALASTLFVSGGNLKHRVNLLPLKTGGFSVSQNSFDIIVPS